MANFVKQKSTASSGTVTSVDTGQDVVIFHNAVSLAITLTVAFPATPVDGQRFTFTSVLGVTTLTLTSAASILGTLGTLAAAGFGTWIYESSDTKWYKIG